jgi:hypothetical protein
MNFEEISLKIDENLVARKNDDGTTILMKMDNSETFYKINGIAALVWDKISDLKPIQSIIEEITTDYDTDIETVKNDVKVLITDLEKYNLIKLNF